MKNDKNKNKTQKNKEPPKHIIPDKMLYDFMNGNLKGEEKKKAGQLMRQEYGRWWNQGTPENPRYPAAAQKRTDNYKWGQYDEQELGKALYMLEKGVKGIRGGRPHYSVKQQMEGIFKNLPEEKRNRIATYADEYRAFTEGTPLGEPAAPPPDEAKPTGPLTTSQGALTAAPKAGPQQRARQGQQGASATMGGTTPGKRTTTAAAPATNPQGHWTDKYVELGHKVQQEGWKDTPNPNPTSPKTTATPATAKGSIPDDMLYKYINGDLKGKELQRAEQLMEQQYGKNWNTGTAKKPTYPTGAKDRYVDYELKRYESGVGSLFPEQEPSPNKTRMSDFYPEGTRTGTAGTGSLTTGDGSQNKARMSDFYPEGTRTGTAGAEKLLTGGRSSNKTRMSDFYPEGTRTGTAGAEKLLTGTGASNKTRMSDFYPEGTRTGTAGLGSLTVGDGSQHTPRMSDFYPEGTRTGTQKLEAYVNPAAQPVKQPLSPEAYKTKTSQQKPAPIPASQNRPRGSLMTDRQTMEDWYNPYPTKKELRERRGAEMLKSIEGRNTSKTEGERLLEAWKPWMSEEKAKSLLEFQGHDMNPEPPGVRIPALPARNSVEDVVSDKALADALEKGKGEHWGDVADRLVESESEAQMSEALEELRKDNLGVGSGKGRELLRQATITQDKELREQGYTRQPDGTYLGNDGIVYKDKASVESNQWWRDKFDDPMSEVKPKDDPNAPPKPDTPDVVEQVAGKVPPAESTDAASANNQDKADEASPNKPAVSGGQPASGNGTPSAKDVRVAEGASEEKVEKADYVDQNVSKAMLSDPLWSHLNTMPPATEEERGFFESPAFQTALLTFGLSMIGGGDAMSSLRVAGEAYYQSNFRNTEAYDDFYKYGVPDVVIMDAIRTGEWEEARKFREDGVERYNKRLEAQNPLRELNKGQRNFMTDAYKRMGKFETRVEDFKSALPVARRLQAKLAAGSVDFDQADKLHLMNVLQKVMDPNATTKEGDIKVQEDGLTLKQWLSSKFSKWDPRSIVTGEVYRQIPKEIIARLARGIVEGVDDQFSMIQKEMVALGNEADMFGIPRQQQTFRLNPLYSYVGSAEQAEIAAKDDEEYADMFTVQSKDAVTAEQGQAAVDQAKLRWKQQGNTTAPPPPITTANTTTPAAPITVRPASKTPLIQTGAFQDA